MELCRISLSKMPCIFKDCLSTEELVDFPRDIKQFTIWKQFIIGIEPIFANIPNHKIRKYYKICLDHFEENCLVNLTVVPRGLKPGAFPTIPPKNPPDILVKPTKTVFQSYMQNINEVSLLSTPVLERLMRESMKSIANINKNCLLLLDILPLRDSDIIAIVFMARGLYENYKQLLCYSIEHILIDGVQLAMLISDVLHTAKSLRFRVLGIVCPFDLKIMEGMNVISNHEARMESDSPELYEYIAFDGRRILILYDPCQLLTATNLEFLYMDLKYKMDYKYIIASWHDIALVHEDQINNKNQLLTDEHVYYDKINRKSVRHAAQVFSNLFSDSMLEFKEKHYERYLPTVEGTAKILKFFNDLFDSVNGYKASSPPHKSLYCKVSLRTTHTIYWKKATDLLRHSSFMRYDGQEFKSPVLDKWNLTLHGFLMLWQLLQCQKFITFTPRRVNLDPLQNDLARIRYHFFETKNANGHTKQNYYPNIDEFKESFKYYMEEGANYLSPAGTTFKNKMHNERSDLDYEKYQDETKFHCLPDYCSSILTKVDFKDYHYEGLRPRFNQEFLNSISTSVLCPKKE